MLLALGASVGLHPSLFNQFRYKQEGRFFCHKCKKTVDIYPLSGENLRFQIHESQKCYYYQLIDEEVHGIKIFGFRNGKFKTRDGTWFKFAKDPSSIKEIISPLDKIGDSKYSFYCCNCEYQSKDFYDFIPENN